MSELQTDDPADSLEAAAEALRSAEAAIEDVGSDRVERVVDAYDRFSDLLSQYREPASGSGRETFQAYVEFEGRLEDFIDGLPDDLLHREAFEDAEELLNRRRLEERDFDRAREALAPAREVAALIDDREAAKQRYRDARQAVGARRREVEDQIGSFESTLAYDDVDFAAPVESLRAPIEAYEDAIDDAFRTFKSSASARAVLHLVESTGAYPLVDFRDPPEALQSYLADHPAGEEPIPTLLSWADYSRSKLSHYVADPGTFQARVGSNRTYLSRLDAEPLHVGWPPPPAGELRYRARELVHVVERFAPEETVARLHAVRDLAREERYDRLRRAAVARNELTDEDRRRLRDGSIHDELTALRERRDRLLRALEEHPPI